MPWARRGGGGSHDAQNVLQRHAQRPERICDFRHQVELSVIDRVAECQDSFDIALDEEIAREHQGIAIKAALHEAEQTCQRAGDPRIEPGRKASRDRQARVRRKRLENECERKVGWHDPEPLSGMTTKPVEDVRMAIAYPSQHEEESSLQWEQRQRPHHQRQEERHRG